ncbi:hypothetical protein [Tropicimonas marinistellae]|uniref:hypothetical protein n=1 Tax=Tropicimonas marinistellae TaxID=1739787 RepID=UPI00082E9305|nr:hypothetical protein [Tropicimonas marinistellae]
MRGMAYDGDKARGSQRGSGNARCLFEADGVQLFHRSARSDNAVVLFCEGPTCARIRTNWISAPGRAAVDLFEVRPSRAGHYPPQEMRALCQILTETSSRPAIALGAAMGGQAALHYARQAGCGALLAFSPIGVAPTGDPASGPDLQQDDLAPFTLIAFDPHRADDAAQFAALRQLDGVQPVRLPFMGQRTERTLIGENIARRVFTAVLRGEAGEVARLLRHNRGHDDGFLSRLSIACSQGGHPRWGAEIAAKGDPTRQHLPDLAMARAEAQAALGQPLNAVETLEGLVVAAPESPRYWTLLADRYEAMGQVWATTEVLELALAVTENFGFCWRLLRILAATDDPKARMQARALAELAKHHWPERRAQIARIVRAIPPVQ